MKVKVIYEAVVEVKADMHHNVDAVYTESVNPECNYYWVCRIHENKRIVAKYPWNRIISIEEFYDD